MTNNGITHLETFQLGTVVATGRGIFAGPFASQIPFKNKKDLLRSAQLAKSIGIEIIYLDVFRDGILVTAERLRTLKGKFEELGFEVRGEAALGITSGSFGKQALSRDKIKGKQALAPFDCWNHPETKIGYQKIAKRAAEIFDCVLLDDCLGTNCFCPLCLRDFQDKFGYKIDTEAFLWTFNRISHLTGKTQKIFKDWIKYQIEKWPIFVSKNIVEVMRQVNPDIKIFAKLPEWHEFYNFHGYSLKQISRLFDRVYVGTEIRDHLRDYPYYAFLHAQLVKDYCSYKNGGYTWFDTYSSFSFNDLISATCLIDQARQSMLGGCAEMDIVFLGDLSHKSRHQAVTSLKKEMPVLKIMGSYTMKLQSCGAKLIHTEPNFAGLASVLDNTWGTECLPVRDLYFGSVLGMLGIPLVYDARPENLSKGNVVVITETEMGKGKFIAWDMENFIKSGGIGIFTAKAVESVFRIKANHRLAKLFTEKIPEYPHIPPYTDAIDKLIVVGKKVNCTYPLSAGPLIIPPQNAKIHLYGINNNKKIPLIFERKFGHGKIIALNITFPHKQFLFGYPPEVVNLIRNIFFESMDVKIESRERNICLYLYKGALAVENHNLSPVKFEIVFKRKIKSLRDVITGRRMSVVSGTKQFRIPQKLREKELRLYEIEL